jgi:cbb3-type cytochrome oxidase subunit 3
MTDTSWNLIFLIFAVVFGFPFLLGYLYYLFDPSRKKN